MHAAINSKAQTARVEMLERQIAELQHKLGEDEDADKIVKRHITLLHQYNEAKDATQMLIGRLASLKESTIRRIHQDYGLTDDD